MGLLRDYVRPNRRYNLTARNTGGGGIRACGKAPLLYHKGTGNDKVDAIESIRSNRTDIFRVAAAAESR